MSLYAKIFGGVKEAPTAPAQQQPAAMPNQQLPAGQEPAFQKSGSQDPNSQTPTEPTSPLAEYADLFKMEPPKDGEVLEDDLPFVGIDQEKLVANVKSRNFATPDLSEQMQAALSGDVDAFREVLNEVGRQAFLQAAQFSEGAAERAGRQSLERATKKLPKEVRSVLGHNELVGLNEAFKDPALAPMVSSLRTTFEQKYPDAGPKEIAAAVNKYLTAAAGVLGAPAAADPTQRPTQQQGATVDFAEIFGNAPMQ